MIRRICLFILLVFTLNTMAQTIGEAFYIYRNDGEFNAFFRDEVDSISYSNYDTDSLYYDEVVTQLVYTADSLYRIPLAVIDSVSFVQPIPIYEDNVKELSGDIIRYIQSVGEMSITLLNNTPNDMLPKIGDKLVQLGFTRVYPNGFLGQVASIDNNMDGITISCDSINISDVVKRFYGVYRIHGSDNSSVRLQEGLFGEDEVIFSKTFHPQAIIPIDVNLDVTSIKKEGLFKLKDMEVGSLKLGGACGMSMDFIPKTIDVKVTYAKDVFINLFEQYHATIITDFDIDCDVRVAGVFDGELKTPFEGEVPIPAIPGITFYLNPGAKLELRGEFGASTTYKQRSGSHKVDIKCYPIPAVNSFGISPLLSIVKQRLTLGENSSQWRYATGFVEAKYCLFAEVGFGIVNSKIMKIGGEFEFGEKLALEVSGNSDDWTESEWNTNFYDRTYETNKITLASYASAYGVIGALDDRLKLAAGGEVLVQGKTTERSLFPTFHDVTLTSASGKPSLANSTVQIDGNCLFPIRYGLTLFNEDGIKLQTKFANTPYTTKKDEYSFQASFSNIERGKVYSVYPTIQMFGKNVLASPKAEMQIVFPVEIVAFEVTDAQHSEGAFIHEGKVYDYCFNTSVSVEINSIENVEDWGYAYEDPYGQISLISLYSHGKAWTDTDYAYYRNEKQSTVRLYPYVKYEDENDVRFGTLAEYRLVYNKDESGLCPNGSHPHQIDLGLPSGIKWACCNMSQESPDEYQSDCYGWGIGTDRTHGQFMWYMQLATMTGIIDYTGTDISGTKWDLAIGWKGNSRWRMPRKADYEELISNCEYIWTSINGVNGYLFTAANGKSVFLAACGYAPAELPIETNQKGYYWTSSNEGNYSSAYALVFEKGKLKIEMQSGRLMFPIRPIMR